jgi:hypothetical protein
MRRRMWMEKNIIMKGLLHILIYVRVMSACHIRSIKVIEAIWT